jgi:hypothetical protein
VFSDGGGALVYTYGEPDGGFYQKPDGTMDYLSTTPIDDNEMNTGGLSFTTTAADYNGDGYGDVVMVYDRCLIQIFYGSDAGLSDGGELLVCDNMTSATLFATSSDLEGTGFPDLLISVGESSQSGGNLVGGIEAVLNDNGSFATSLADPRIYTIGNSNRNNPQHHDQPLGVSTGDINGDGNPDAVIADTTGHDVAILLQDGNSGGFQNGILLPTGTGASGQVLVVAAGDVNGDGLADALGVGPSSDGLSPGVLWLFLSQGAGFFTCETYNGPLASFSVSMGDLNNDGLADIVVADIEGHTPTVLLTHGDAGL